MSMTPKPTTDLVFLHEANGELSLHFDAPSDCTTIQSRMQKDAPEHLVLDYTRSMMGFLLFQPRPKRIAMIGLGGGSLAKYCRQKLPDADFTALELNPAVIALRDRFGIPPDSSHFRVLCVDGAEYLRHNEIEKHAFDVLLIDGFNRDGQPAQLCSLDFYQDCYTQLNTGGILVVNLCADDTGYGRYVGRIRKVFAEKVVVVEADDRDNKIVFASKEGAFPPNLDKLTERLRALETSHSIGLAETAQQILRHGQEQHPARKKRR